MKISNSAFSQKVFNYEIEQTGEIFLTSEIVIPKVNNGFTIRVPEKDKIKGMIMFIHGRRETANSDTIINYELNNDPAVMYATTDKRLEFFFEEEKKNEILNYIDEVTQKYNVNKENILYCGMSFEGTRALKLAIYSQIKDPDNPLKPKAIAVCDSPLDMVRFHKEMVKANELNYTSVTANEGTWGSGYFEKNL